jgi:hypothetical protein
MHGAVGFSVLDKAAIVLGTFSPPLLVRMKIDQPKLPAKKSLAPIGPGFSLVSPFASGGVYGEPIGVRHHQVVEL